MKTKTYKVYDSEDCLYTISVDETSNGTSYVLSKSSDSLWSHPGEIVLSAVDNGGGIKFSKKQNMHLEYDEFSELTILSSFIAKYDKQIMGDHTIVKETNFCKI